MHSFPAFGSGAGLVYGEAETETDDAEAKADDDGQAELETLTFPAFDPGASRSVVLPLPRYLQFK
ncbi:hypothetical protein PtrM4_043920 [Pyrenophora tritici-repentis]|uniref:Uncharacterized protein n=1 Tax=Pyrenophora tritici-repentis TaxID=45151 RepID=A0A2W1F207_9PLEO|nr:hypothetical protein A1F99_109430 [Pyrenophora tritici-repentis]KAF7564958.1 hypothetical protein PtrM4_043920 [Pyrenophora tritici-repentis]KAI0615041.1 hypothetical protein TUN205_00755 [Pyrenophora tritici-repentis]KAI1579438.1 hypothetical protein PtrEW4_000500 [Pyrenophora tritici-repentis]KAI1667805.1 hypothetical protein L13192_08514 [Pyrenophora tritici-repentis]